MGFAMRRSLGDQDSAPVRGVPYEPVVLYYSRVSAEPNPSLPLATRKRLWDAMGDEHLITWSFLPFESSLSRHHNDLPQSTSKVLSVISMREEGLFVRCRRLPVYGCVDAGCAGRNPHSPGVGVSVSFVSFVSSRALQAVVSCAC